MSASDKCIKPTASVSTYSVSRIVAEEIFLCAVRRPSAALRGRTTDALAELETPCFDYDSDTSATSSTTRCATEAQDENW